MEFRLRVKRWISPDRTVADGFRVLADVFTLDWFDLCWRVCFNSVQHVLIVFRHRDSEQNYFKHSEMALAI